MGCVFAILAEVREGAMGEFNFRFLDGGGLGFEEGIERLVVEEGRRMLRSWRRARLRVMAS